MFIKLKLEMIAYRNQYTTKLVITRAKSLPWIGEFRAKLENFDISMEFHGILQKLINGRWSVMYNLQLHNVT